MISMHFDEATGIVRSVGEGHWSVAEAETYYARLRMIVARLRAQGRPIRILIDATRAEMQAPDVQARSDEHVRRLYRPCDRVAIVVRNSLVKHRAKDLLPSSAISLFCSALAAETWLSAYDQRLSA